MISFQCFFVPLLMPLLMKMNVWHGIEQCKIDLSIDQWHA